MNKTIDILKDNQVVSTIKPANGTYSIGRDPGSDIVLADAAVSKHHATMILSEDKVTIKDNNSANGIFLKGKKISEYDFSGGFEFEIKPFIIRCPDAIAFSPDIPGKAKNGLPALRITNIRTSVFTLVAAVMLCTLLIGYLPLKQQVGAIHRREVLKNGIVLSRYLAEMNRPAIADGQLEQTRISPIEKEDGVIYAFVLDAHGRIIAPQEKQGDFFNWKGLAQALQNGHLSIDDGPRNEKIIFYPVTQGNRTLGAAIIGFAHDRVAETIAPGFGAFGWLLLAVLFSIGMGIAHLLAKAFIKPLRQLNEEMEIAIKEGRGHLKFIAPYVEIDNLKRTFERLLMRKAAPTESETPSLRTSTSKDAPIMAGDMDLSAIRPDASQASPVPKNFIDDQLRGVSAPWCVINRQNYGICRFSDHFTQIITSPGCKEGMHIIEAFDTDMIQVVSQLMDAPDDKELAMDHPDGKHILRRVYDPADPDHIALIFEEKA
jgi:hypothetical protein